MALMDRFREAWEDLRSNYCKEEQEPTSVTQSVAHSPMQWGKDYKAAVTLGESIEPVPLDRGLATIVQQFSVLFLNGAHGATGRALDTLAW